MQAPRRPDSQTCGTKSPIKFMEYWEAANLRGFCASVNARFYGWNPRFYGRFQYILMWYMYKNVHRQNLKLKSLNSMSGRVSSRIFQPGVGGWGVLLSMAIK